MLKFLWNKHHNITAFEFFAKETNITNDYYKTLCEYEKAVAGINTFPISKLKSKVTQ